jgi:hypothetical protein
MLRSHDVPRPEQECGHPDPIEQAAERKPSSAQGAAPVRWRAGAAILYSELIETGDSVKGGMFLEAEDHLH